MIQYKHFAVPNVWLRNGYEVSDSPYGETTSYEDVRGLERLLRLTVLYQPTLLSGAQVRFLRMGLGLSQPEFSRLFCVDSQTVARWEKGESAVTPIIDWAVRLEVVRRWQPALQAIEFPQARHRDSSPSPIELEYVNGSWRKADVRHSAHVQLALLAQAEADIAKARRAVDDFFVSDMSKMVAESRSLSAAMEEQAKMYFLELNRLRPEYSSEKPVSVTALLSAGPTEEDKESA